MADNKDLVEDVKVETDDNDADFESGFENPTAKTPAVAPAEVEEEEVDPEKKVDAEKKEDDEPKDPPDPKDPPPPEYVQITKEQLSKLENAATEVTAMKSQIDKAFGSIGGIQQLVNDLKAKTPKGTAVEIPADLFDEEFETEFPDIAKGMRAALEKTLKNASGTGDSRATVDPEEVTRQVAEGIRQREMETLEDTYPDWKEIVGAVDSADKADPNNSFRKWLATQPADYQAKINGTHSAPVLARAIDRFKDATKTPPPKDPVPPKKETAPKDDVRKNRIHNAVQPKGDGHVPKPKPTDDDAFMEGFDSG